MELVYYPDDRLFAETGNVGVFDEVLQNILQAMVGVMHDNYGIGLAAPQVGLTQRMFVVKIPEDKEARLFVNPVILETSADTWEYEEGCLSIPEIYAPVQRSQTVLVRAQDQFGKKFTLEANGLLGRVILHEMDHLNGVLFIDHLSKDVREEQLILYNSIER